MMKQQIFLLGSERSGSNLLRTLIGKHSQISAPVAPHFCDIFFNKFKFYLPLDDKKRFELINDLEKYVNHPFNDWEMKFDFDYITSNYRLDSFIDFMQMAYNEKARTSGKNGYFSKDNHMHKYALGTLKDVPNARFIYLYRDVRDQVASWLRTPIHLHTPYKAVNKWVHEQNECIALNTFYDVPICSVKYEDLVSDTRTVMTNVLDFLSLPLEEECFTTDKGNKDAEKHVLWKNINKPIIKNNYGKYKDVLSGEDLNMVESISQKLMLQLGFSPETDCNWQMKNKYFFLLKEKISESVSKRKNKDVLTKEMGLLKDKNDLVNSIFSKFQ